MILLHGIASRGDLPLPFELVLGGAAVVLIVTFWVALYAWRTPRFRDHTGVELPRLTRVVDSPWFSRPLRIAVGLVWLWAALALTFGVDRIDNPVFGFVYVLLWVGLVPMSLIFGGVYRRTNPLRLLLRFAGATGAAIPGGAQGSRLPAAGALMAFLYLELVQPDGATLPVLRGFAAAWVAWVVVGVMVRGQRWIAQADPFEAYASAVARLSPWGRNARGILLWMHPLRNLASWRAPAHLAALASVLLGGTLFDALSNTAWWVRATQDLDVWAWPAALAGLLGSVGAVYALFWLGSRAYGRGRVDALAPGLIPLVAGYALAHYSTMLYLEGQRTVIRFSDPMGLGWNVFGLAEAAPGTGLFAYPTLIAVAQVLLIVGGHVAAVLVTHDIALRTHPDRVWAHVPLLSMMVAFTVGGLVLMFGGG
ncbi:MAG TPA: hypothetical protein VLQ67_01330 [Arachnia sp.]|nr:hypothetical protein [Arachnia sp.]